MEVRGDAHRLLAGRGVGDEEDFLRLEEFLQLLEFLDQRLVDFLPAGGVENLDVAALRSAGPGDWRRPARLTSFSPACGRENRDADLLAERRELLDRGGALQIARDEKRRAALLLQQVRQLRRRGRLAGAVQADHQDARRLVEIQRLGVAAEQRGQLVVEDFDDLLAGRDAAEDFLAERLFLDPRDEILRDLEIDVRLEQRQPHLAHGVVDVRLADRPVAAEVLEDVLQLVGEL